MLWPAGCTMLCICRARALFIKALRDMHSLITAVMQAGSHHRPRLMTLPFLSIAAHSWNLLSSLSSSIPSLHCSPAASPLLYPWSSAIPEPGTEISSALQDMLKLLLPESPVVDQTLICVMLTPNRYASLSTRTLSPQTLASFVIP